MGSEMCIRDRGGAVAPKKGATSDKKVAPGKGIKMPQRAKKAKM